MLLGLIHMVVNNGRLPTASTVVLSYVAALLPGNTNSVLLKLGRALSFPA